jgi:hypothetical protein
MARHPRLAGRLGGPLFASLLIHAVALAGLLTWWNRAESIGTESAEPADRSLSSSVAVVLPPPPTPEESEPVPTSEPPAPAPEPEVKPPAAPRAMEPLAQAVPEPEPVLPPPPPAPETPPEEVVEPAPTVAPTPVVEPEPQRVLAQPRPPDPEPQIAPEPVPAVSESPVEPETVEQVAAPIVETLPVHTVAPEPVTESPHQRFTQALEERLAGDAEELMAAERLIESSRSRDEALRYRERLLATAGLEDESLRTFPRVVCTYENLLDRLLMLDRLDCQLVALHPDRPEAAWAIDPHTGQAERRSRSQFSMTEFSPRVIDPIAQGHGHEFFRQLVTHLAQAEGLDPAQIRLEGLLPVEQDRMIAFKQRWVMQQMAADPQDVWATRGHFVYTRQGVAVFVVDALVLRSGDERRVRVTDPELSFLGAVQPPGRIEPVQAQALAAASLNPRIIGD